MMNHDDTTRMSNWFFVSYQVVVYVVPSW